MNSEDGSRLVSTSSGRLPPNADLHRLGGLGGERRPRRHTFVTWIAEHPEATSRMAYDRPERAEGKEAAMFRIIQRGLLAALLVGVLAVPGIASAAANPSGTGQPSQSCLSQSAPAEPGGSASAPGSAFNENGGIADRKSVV